MFLFLRVVKTRALLARDKQSQTIPVSIGSPITHFIYAPIYKLVFWFQGGPAKVTKIATMGWKIWFRAFWPTWRTQPSLWWSDALHMEHSHEACTRNTHLYYLAHSSDRGPFLYPRSYKEKRKRRYQFINDVVGIWCESQITYRTCQISVFVNSGKHFLLITESMVTWQMSPVSHYSSFILMVNSILCAQSKVWNCRIWIWTWVFAQSALSLPF